jgi:hypothetical protein
MFGTGRRHMCPNSGGIGHLNKIRGVAQAGERLENASNTPASRSRQNHFHTDFRGPNSAGRAARQRCSPWNS